jgi:hypothetical protein
LVVAPLDGQSYNRYAHVRNRPLVATDPTGYDEQSLGGDDGDADARSLGRECIPGERDFYRPIVVGDPDMAGSADTWNRAEQMFEADNGQARPAPQQPPRQPLLPPAAPTTTTPAVPRRALQQRATAR